MKIFQPVFCRKRAERDGREGAILRNSAGKVEKAVLARVSAGRREAACATGRQRTVDPGNDQCG